MTRELWLIALVGCGGPSTSSTPAAPVPSLDVPPLSASSAAPEQKPATAPKLDATCKTNEDCVAVFTGDDCCHECKPRFANVTWQREIEAFCAKIENSHDCGPMACSWGFNPPKCEKGLCK